jgi:hypothetical protein
MAQDYYPLLSRAVASLEQNTPETRQVVCVHARTSLREQVRDHEPPLSPRERMDELLALEQAIRKVELEAARSMVNLAAASPREDEPLGSLRAPEARPKMKLAAARLARTAAPRHATP